MSLNEYICPTCGKKMPMDVSIIISHTEEDIIEVIKKKNPKWVEKDGVCRKCYTDFKNQLHPK